MGWKIIKIENNMDTNQNTIKKWQWSTLYKFRLNCMDIKFEII